MVKHAVVSIIVSAAVLALFPFVRPTHAATLQFEPSTVTTTAGRTFEAKVSVNSAGEEINGVDAFVLYDANLLEIAAINNGTFFPTVLTDPSKAGRAYIAGIVDAPGTFKIGAGTIATVVFRAKANGTATVAFECVQGSSKDSNVVKNDLNASDIIVCASNGSQAVTIGGGVTTTTTATTTLNPTATPIPTAAAAPQQPTAVPTLVPPKALPKSGVVENIARYATQGFVLVVIGFGLRLLL